MFTPTPRQVQNTNIEIQSVLVWLRVCRQLGSVVLGCVLVCNICELYKYQRDYLYVYTLLLRVTESYMCVVLN